MNDSRIIKMLQADPAIRVIHEGGGASRKMYWNHDTKEWEVYSRHGNKITFHYTGKDLGKALEELRVRC